MVERDVCPGCGVSRAPTDVPAHPYIGASPACWARYGELLALEYGSPALMRWHRLTVDAYAAQHPGEPGRRSAQSVHVHLAALHLTLEQEMDEAAVRRAMQRMADGGSHQWLEPPDLRTDTGLDAAIEAAGSDRYGQAVTAWAQAVWRAWEPHRDTIRREAKAALTSH